MHRRPSQSFERSNISCRRNLLFYRLRFSPNSDCICTESNLHVFCSKRYTESVSISIETSAKNKIRIHSEYPGPRNKDARDVSTDLSYTTVSCPYEGRAMDPIYIYIYINQKLDGDPYRTTPISFVRPGLEASLRSAITF